MTKTRLTLPYLLTVANLLCGFLSIAYGLHGKLIEASWLIMVAGLMDGLDGKIARFAGSSTRFGVEFDSMADLISFGMAPGIVMHIGFLHVIGGWGWMLTFLYIASGAFRLARFNYQFNGTREDSFRGMPITMAGMTVAALLIFSDEIKASMGPSTFPAVLTILLSVLMVSTLRYEGLPSFHLANRREKIKALVLLFCTAMIAVRPPLMLFPCMTGYVVLGPIQWILSMAERRETERFNRNHHSARHK